MLLLESAKCFLSFCRKICRNCKCGLTEHDVSMNSEENKKVGKLFEDTKYTGLIAKLKTDGIPGYQGNMVTITLPSPTTAYVVSPSISSTMISPSATAGSVQPVEAGSAGSAPASGQAQARPQPTPVPASVTPVKANKVPVAISATSANVTPVPKEVPMKSVTYEWAPPVANRYLVSIQTNTQMFSVCICVCLVYCCICRTHVLHVLSPQDSFPLLSFRLVHLCSSYHCPSDIFLYLI